MDPETGEVTAVIETPKGSPNKYDYDPSCGAFRLAGVMPEGSTFPYDTGFIPSTLGDDGDPLAVFHSSCTACSSNSSASASI